MYSATNMAAGVGQKGVPSRIHPALRRTVDGKTEGMTSGGRQETDARQVISRATQESRGRVGDAELQQKVGAVRNDATLIHLWAKTTPAAGLVANRPVI